MYSKLSKISNCFKHFKMHPIWYWIFFLVSLSACYISTYRVVSRDFFWDTGIWSFWSLRSSKIELLGLNYLTLLLFPTNIYLFKVSIGNLRKRCEICSKLTTKTPERHQWLRSGVFIVNSENISHLFLMFLLSTLNK